MGVAFICMWNHSEAAMGNEGGNIIHVAKATLGGVELGRASLCRSQTLSTGSLCENCKKMDTTLNLNFAKHFSLKEESILPRAFTSKQDVQEMVASISR